MRQTFRPKHQILVLKCYPKFLKTVVDPKPNPSELSYLLYYASTRRSKLPKVGSFLEKRTASDIKHGRSWCVVLRWRSEWERAVVLTPASRRHLGTS